MCGKHVTLVLNLSDEQEQSLHCLKGRILALFLLPLVGLAKSKHSSISSLAEILYHSNFG